MMTDTIIKYCLGYVIESLCIPRAMRSEAEKDDKLWYIEQSLRPMNVLRSFISIVTIRVFLI